MTQRPNDDAPTCNEQPTASIENSPASPRVDRLGDGISHPERIGPYIIREVIGEGGFGYVYAADQVEPVKRRVALKVIKPGMDSKAVIARFEAERQALAVMDHPGVAKVFDGGTVPDGQPGAGRPYFVMEYVKGEPITTFCDRNRLTIDERVELMIQACEAVQHAHTKAVIHRDIKPSNILVGYVDGKPTAKVIDFGIAKSINQRFSEATIFTERGQMIGTPEYMSPEQAEMSGVDIDTRSDVYSLGVVLYELLTGVRPFDLRRLALDEMVRVIRETPPPLPSSRMNAAGKVNNISNNRPQEKSFARPHMTWRNRDLDWICMKCLCKSRDDRYEGARDLGRDLGASLRGDPVVATGPSFLDSADRLYRENRNAIRGAAAILSLSLVIFGAIIFGARRSLYREHTFRVAGTTICLMAIYGLSSEDFSFTDSGGYSDRTRRTIMQLAVRDAGRKFFAYRSGSVAEMPQAVDLLDLPGFRWSAQNRPMPHYQGVLVSVFLFVVGVYGVLSVLRPRAGPRSAIAKILIFVLGVVLFFLFLCLVCATDQTVAGIGGYTLLMRWDAWPLFLVLLIPIIADSLGSERIAVGWRPILSPLGGLGLAFVGGGILFSASGFLGINAIAELGARFSEPDTKAIKYSAIEYAGGLLSVLENAILETQQESAIDPGG